MARSVVIHGHYYQPPREDPWLGEIERQHSAAPFHDWNERIEDECYRAVVAARVLDGEGRIARVVNALAYTSFDFGPTLLGWLARKAPATYESVLEADRASAARLGGHGNAIAQAYHHTILPLASRRDKITEVRWGIADFRRRFGRAPEGMWLPETAADDETLDVLAAEGIRFTILAPHQVEAAPRRGMPGLYKTANGREIALFVYDGPTSHGIAFGGVLDDAGAWAARLTAGLRDTDGPDEMLALASDGETYGHHHRFGEMALAAVIDALERRPGVRLDNFASFLAAHPATTPVALVGPSAWSCSHGVERWRSDCGCGASSSGLEQGWRTPLREGMHALAEGLDALYAREGAAHFTDVWAARDAYGAEGFTPPDERLSALGPRLSAPAPGGPRAPESTEGSAESTRPPSAGTRPRAESQPVRARELLEMERNALRLFTSCAWFFDDVDRLEPLQIMRYAARAIELAGAEGPALEARLLETLARARSNDPEAGTGRDIYLRKAKPQRPPYARIAAAHALARLLGVGDADLLARAATVEQSADGRSVVVRERRTGREHAFDVAPSLGGVAEEDGALRRARHAAVDVRPAGGGEGDALRMTLADVPEPLRDAILDALRRDVVARGLDDASRARLAAGTPLADILPGALHAAVASLATRHGTAASTVARVLDLADLLEETGLAIPFDAQTAFARVRGGLAGSAMLLAPVGERLGFVTRLSALGSRLSASAPGHSETRIPATRDPQSAESRELTAESRASPSAESRSA